MLPMLAVALSVNHAKVVPSRSAVHKTSATTLLASARFVEVRFLMPWPPQKIHSQTHKPQGSALLHTLFQRLCREKCAWVLYIPDKPPVKARFMR
jgi:hypothetical protein